MCEDATQTRRTDQESGGVVQQAAEAAHKVPLQEGGVLWGKLVGAVCHRFIATQERWRDTDGKGRTLNIRAEAQIRSKSQLMMLSHWPLFLKFNFI